MESAEQHEAAKWKLTKNARITLLGWNLSRRLTIYLH